VVAWDRVHAVRGAQFPKRLHVRAPRREGPVDGNYILD
jgi:hypothetical protein